MTYLKNAGWVIAGFAGGVVVPPDKAWELIIAVVNFAAALL